MIVCKFSPCVWVHSFPSRQHRYDMRVHFYSFLISVLIAAHLENIRSFYLSYCLLGLTPEHWHTLEALCRLFFWERTAHLLSVFKGEEELSKSDHVCISNISAFGKAKIGVEAAQTQQKFDSGQLRDYKVQSTPCKSPHLLFEGGEKEKRKNETETGSHSGVTGSWHRHGHVTVHFVWVQLLLPFLVGILAFLANPPQSKSSGS
ncbi:hypothetical protein GE09DRAFT_196158 [Coniochaeta sp. 2T2.1]|nr:hypothetical protein GE09DRAFT_196158 [Coniochaeta sp. 2T2.1]